MHTEGMFLSGIFYAEKLQLHKNAGIFLIV